MSGLGWLAIGVICGVVLLFALALCMVAADSEERDRMWYHPPDDDDGISIKEDDPDGKYTR